MRINWVFAEGYVVPHDIDLAKIKNIGPIWASWRNWRACGVDNAICHDLARCQELLQRAFQAVCNFYVPKKHYQTLGRPLGVKLYDGDFVQDLDHHEDIIATHLAATCSDLILLVGFDLAPADPNQEKFLQVKRRNYLNLLMTQIANNAEIQWVLIDDAQKELPKDFKHLGNLTSDSFANALSLLD